MDDEPSTVISLAVEKHMSDPRVVASLCLTVVLAAATVPNLLGSAFATKNAERLGISTGLYLFGVGASRGLAIVGVVVGLFWWPIGVVAAGAVALLMIAAVGAHWRTGEPVSKALPAVIGLVLIAVVIAGQVLMLTR